ncbi:MAG: phytanoyl-CoA dioxygenase family protein [Actinomycetota bacterium]
MSALAAGEDAVVAYYAEGRARAFDIGNRGPVRFVGGGALHPDIVEAYWRTGFYVFEGVIGDEELADIRADIVDFRRRLPTHRGSEVDVDGNPAVGTGLRTRSVVWGKALSDPVGGTSASHGRHPVKMAEPVPAPDAPDEVVYVVVGSLQYIDAHLRLYGHPDLLGVAAALNGDDFTPFNEGIFIKDPGVGPSVAWHRDGVTHWDSPDWDQGSHGFNLMAQVEGCEPENGVWVLPGSHKLRTVDLGARVEAAGGDRLPEAVPLVCAPGDVAIVNRQAVHGSFANTSERTRVTLNLGFHRRRSVLGETGSGIHGIVGPLDESRVAERSKVIGYAIAARAQRYPDEVAFDYRPLRGQAFVWDEEARAALHDYNALDLSI